MDETMTATNSESEVIKRTSQIREWCDKIDAALSEKKGFYWDKVYDYSLFIGDLALTIEELSGEEINNYE